MSFEVYFTRTALRDMREAADYIEFALKKPRAADALLSEAETALAALSRAPFGHAVEDDPVLSAWGVRHVAVGHYLAFYVISEAERRVYVARFLYYRRDWATILRRENVTRRKALDAFEKMRRQASEVPEMSLDEINAEIRAARERK